MKCMECRTPMVSLQEAYKYKESGLPYVTLQNVMVNRCPSCGEEVISIPKVSELHKVLACAVASKPSRLGGDEIRFLRKYLGWSGVQFANIMGIAPETVSRWENSAASMGQTAERMLRLMVFRLEPVEKYPTEDLADLGNEGGEKFSLDILPTKSGWSVTRRPINRSADAR